MSASCHRITVVATAMAACVLDNFRFQFVMRRRSKQEPFVLIIYQFNGILQVGGIEPGGEADLKNKKLEQRPLVCDQRLYRSDVIECANGIVDAHGICRELRENLVVHMCIRRRVWGSAESMKLDLETTLHDGGCMIVTNCYTGLAEPDSGYLAAQAGEQVMIFRNTLKAGGARNMSKHYVYAELPTNMAPNAEGAFGPRGWFPVDHLGLQWPDPEDDVEESAPCELG